MGRRKVASHHRGQRKVSRDAEAEPPKSTPKIAFWEGPHLIQHCIFVLFPPEQSEATHHMTLHYFLFFNSHQKRRIKLYFLVKQRKCKQFFPYRTSEPNVTLSHEGQRAGYTCPRAPWRGSKIDFPAHFTSLVLLWLFHMPWLCVRFCW